MGGLEVGWEAGLSCPLLFQRNSTAVSESVSESVRSCLLALPMLFSTQIGFLLLCWALGREQRSPWNRCSSVARSVKPSGVRGNPPSPHQCKLMLQHPPMSWVGQGLSICWSDCCKMDRCQGTLLVQVAKRQQHGLGDARDGEERDSEISGMRSHPGLGLLKERGAPAASTV